MDDKTTSAPSNFMDLDADMVVNDAMSPQREIPDVKNYQAVIAMVVPAGTHTDTFPGKAPITAKKALAILELGKKSDGSRFVFSRKWTFSLADTANMKKDLSGAGVDTSKDFNLKDLVGMNVMVQVTHKKKQTGNGVTPKYGIFAQLPDGMPHIKPTITELPDWAKVYISGSVEYKQKHGTGAVGPYAEAIKKEMERKAKYGTKPGNVAEAPAQEDDLPF